MTVPNLINFYLCRFLWDVNKKLLLLYYKVSINVLFEIGYRPLAP